MKDFIANLTDIVGGRSGQYEEALRTARQEAIREMSDEARGRGADAVVAVDIDYEVLGRNNGMLLTSGSCR